jgi:membrane glycosyltransferase
MSLNVSARDLAVMGATLADGGVNPIRAAVYVLFCVVALEAALNFSVPLYIQIVQGRSPIATAVATMPFNLTVFFTAMLIVRFYDKFTPRQSDGFILCTVALLWLAFCRA